MDDRCGGVCKTGEIWPGDGLKATLVSRRQNHEYLAIKLTFVLHVENPENRCCSSTLRTHGLLHFTFGSCVEGSPMKTEATRQLERRGSFSCAGFCGVDPHVVPPSHDAILFTMAEGDNNQGNSHNDNVHSNNHNIRLRARSCNSSQDIAVLDVLQYQPRLPLHFCCAITPTKSVRRDFKSCSTTTACVCQVFGEPGYCYSVPQTTFPSGLPEGGVCAFGCALLLQRYLVTLPRPLSGAR